MQSVDLILVARAVHVVGGVIWAGFILLVALLVPMMVRDPSLSALRGFFGRIMPRIAGPSGLLTVLAGIYLMMVLHPGDQSNTGRALEVGAVAAILTFVIGAALIGPRARKLASLAAGGAAVDPQQRERLQSGLVLAARLNAGVMLVAVLAMATARYL